MRNRYERLREEEIHGVPASRLLDSVKLLHRCNQSPICEQRARQVAEALTLIEQHAEQDLALVARMRLAFLFAETERIDEAIESFRSVMRSGHPDRVPQAAVALGWHFERWGRRSEEAAIAWQQAIGLRARGARSPGGHPTRHPAVGARSARRRDDRVSDRLDAEGTRQLRGDGRARAAGAARRRPLDPPAL